MNYGPFSESQAEQIREKLEELGVEYRPVFSPDAVADWRAKLAKRPVTRYPKSIGPIEAIFIELNEQDFKIIGTQLEIFGIVPHEPRPTELDAFEDFLCPECEHSGRQGDFCPRHNKQLITFDQKVEYQRSKPDYVTMVFRVLVILFLVTVALVSVKSFIENVIQK